MSEESLEARVKAAILDAFGDLRTGILDDVDQRVDAEMKVFNARQEREHMKTRAFVAVASLPAWGRSATGVIGSILVGASWHFGWIVNLLHLF